MKKLFSLITILLFQISNAQNNDFQQKVDSLFTQSALLENSIAKVEVLLEISSICIISDLPKLRDTSTYFIDRAIEIAEKIDHRKGLADGLYNKGRSLIGLGKPALGTQYFLKSLAEFTQLNDSKGIAKCYMQLGLVSYMMQDFETAKKNLKKSIEADEGPTGIYLLALTYTELDSIELAKTQFSKCIDIFKKVNAYQQIEESYLYLGRLHLKSGNLDSALLYMNYVVDRRKAADDKEMLIRPYAFLSEIYVEANNMDSVIHYGELSYQLEINKTKSNQDEISLIQATKNLSIAYAKKGDYKKAHEFLILFNEYNAIFTEGNTKQKVANLQSKFIFEKEMSYQKLIQQREKEIAEQQIAKERILRNGFIGGFAIVLLFAGVFFVQRNRIGKEKERSEELLLNILPEETAKELKEKGHSDAQLIEHVTVLFTDFRGFTSMSEQVTPKELVADLHACFSEFDRICEKYGIEKIKTIGDAYMAAGGLPTPNQTHPFDVVKAALDMADIVKQGKAKKIAEKLPYFEIRVGVHTGPVVAGIVGVKKFQYDIWGDTVNTASRMESASGVGKVNLSQATYEMVKEDPSFSFEGRGKIEAKGKGEMDMYFVTLRT